MTQIDTPSVPLRFQWRSISLAIAMFLGVNGNGLAATAETLEKRVETLELRISSARAKFAIQLENLKTRVIRKRIPSDTKSAWVQTIATELSQFKTSHKLPDHPALIGHSYEFALTTKPILSEAEKLRLDVVEQGIRQAGTAEASRLKKLEGRIEDILASSGKIAIGSTWHGCRTYPDGAAQPWKMRIEKVVGNDFSGTLMQSYSNGTSDVMGIAGTHANNNLSIRTTGMRKGAPRYLLINGMMVGDQVLATVSGVTASGQPATGYVAMRK